MFGCPGSLLLHGLLSSCSGQASHCSGFPCCGAQALGHIGSVVAAPRLWSTGLVVVWCMDLATLGPLCGMWDLPRSGVEPMSPALAGGFFTPEALGEPSTRPWASAYSHCNTSAGWMAHPQAWWAFQGWPLRSQSGWYPNSWKPPPLPPNNWNSPLTH